MRPSDPVSDVIKTASLAATSVTAKVREGRMAGVIKTLAGPAISLMVMGNVGILAWGSKIHLWTEVSEETRASYVGMIGVSLSVMMGLALWVLMVGRPTRMEISAGPGSVTIDNTGNQDAEQS